MTISSSASTDGQSLTIGVSGLFDFGVHREFRDAYEANSKGIKDFVIDLHDTEFMDSTACGMLLVFRDYVGGDSASVKIVNCNDDIKSVLGLVHFDKLFNIS